MESLTKKLASALDRQRLLRARGGNFDERARLQSDIHSLRAAIGAHVHRLPPV